MSEKYYKVYQTDFDRYSLEITHNFRNQQRFVNLELDQVDLTAMMEMLDSLGFEDRSEEINYEE